MDTIIDELKKLEEEIKRCRKCPLYKTRTNAVPGEGSTNPKIFFIGEAPGAQEDATGRPFVGAAGKLLTTLLNEIGLSREEVYITNVIKCRPPGNRDPAKEEVEACRPYLEKQLKLMRPKAIVALGRHAASWLSSYMNRRFRSMTREHGIIFESEILGFKARILFTYHPAAALYNPNLLDSLRKDFEKIKEMISKDRRRGTLEDYL